METATYTRTTTIAHSGTATRPLEELARGEESIWQRRAKRAEAAAETLSLEADELREDLAKTEEQYMILSQRAAQEISAAHSAITAARAEAATARRELSARTVELYSARSEIERLRGHIVELESELEELAEESEPAPLTPAEIFEAEFPYLRVGEPNNIVSLTAVYSAYRNYMKLFGGGVFENRITFSSRVASAAISAGGDLHGNSLCGITMR